MKIHLNFFFFLLSGLCCLGQMFAQSKDHREIIQQSAQFSAYYVQGNFKGMADTYTEDALLFPPGKDIVVGKAAILSFWENLPKTILLSHKTVPEKIIIKGKEAHDYGYYFVQSQKEGEAPGPVFSAKYYIIWVKDKDRGWKMKMDMWNSRNADWNK